jgi:hypothetical protein
LMRWAGIFTGMCFLVHTQNFSFYKEKPTSVG